MHPFLLSHQTIITNLFTSLTSDHSSSQEILPNLELLFTTNSIIFIAWWKCLLCFIVCIAMLYAPIYYHSPVSIQVQPQTKKNIFIHAHNEYTKSRGDSCLNMLTHQSVKCSKKCSVLFLEDNWLGKNFSQFFNLSVINKQN